MVDSLSQPDTLERLYEALRLGDQAALDSLLQPLRERLTRLAKERLRGIDCAEEVVQETLVTLWEKRGSVRDPDHVLPFVFQILRNKIGNLYLRERRQRKFTAAGVDPGEQRTIDPEADPATIVEAQELEGILAQTIRRCANEDRTLGRVLQLLKEGKDHSEIQRALGAIPRATVRTRIFRARKRLREILSEVHQIEL